MGIQIATAYIDTTLMPPFFGIIASKLGFSQLPIWLLPLSLAMIITTEIVNTKITNSPHT